MKYLLIALISITNLQMFAYEELMLSCEGVGSNVKSSSINLNQNQTFNNSNSWDLNNSTSSTGNISTKENFNASITVFFSEKGSWIQMPLSLTSGLNKMSNAFKKDKKNKWDMYDVDVTEEEFKGRFKLNVLNKPQVVVNRFSATIVMDGFGNGFNGKCKKIDTKEKQF
ncbi:hypothetical protein OAT61_03035 [Gammaproteobacteria bacterium]|mgnify:FL=1|nr:hypothetical protein [Gammaproteobacteria bacterium]|tara:strand:- start:914 stop:1420 length:507 start_codon:yes stop_codon:yes gene_type:complete